MKMKLTNIQKCLLSLVLPFSEVNRVKINRHLHLLGNMVKQRQCIRDIFYIQNVKFITYLFLIVFITQSCSSSNKVVRRKDEKNSEKEVSSNENKLKENKIDTNIIIEPFEDEKTFKFKFDKSPLLGEVLARAEKENKWIYIDMSAKWCAPCQIMKRDVYTNEETSDYFNENFITYLVDVEKAEGPDLKLIFEVKSYPTLLFIDFKGREMLRKESAVSASGLMSFGQEAKRKISNQ